jgi:hypothetical protein
MLLTMLLLTFVAACGDSPKEERKAPKPEETVFRDLVTAPDKVQQRTDAAVDANRKALEERLREGEGGPARE